MKMVFGPGFDRLVTSSEQLMQDCTRVADARGDMPTSSDVSVQDQVAATPLPRSTILQFMTTLRWFCLNVPNAQATLTTATAFNDVSAFLHTRRQWHLWRMLEVPILVGGLLSEVHAVSAFPLLRTLWDSIASSNKPEPSKTSPVEPALSEDRLQLPGAVHTPAATPVVPKPAPAAVVDDDDASRFAATRWPPRVMTETLGALHRKQFLHIAAAEKRCRLAGAAGRRVTAEDVSGSVPVEWPSCVLPSKYPVHTLFGVSEDGLQAGEGAVPFLPNHIAVTLAKRLGFLSEEQIMTVFKVR